MKKLYIVGVFKIFCLLCAFAIIDLNKANAQSYISTPAGYQDPQFIISYNGYLYFTASVVGAANERAVFKLSMANNSQTPVKISTDLLTHYVPNSNEVNNSKLIINGNIYFTTYNLLIKLVPGSDAVTQLFAVPPISNNYYYGNIVNIYSLPGKIIIQTAIGANGAFNTDASSYDLSNGTTTPLVPVAPPSDYLGYYAHQFTVNTSNNKLDYLVYKAYIAPPPISGPSNLYCNLSQCYQVETDGTANGTVITRSVTTASTLSFFSPFSNLTQNPRAQDENIPPFFSTTVVNNGLTYTTFSPQLTGLTVSDASGNISELLTNNSSLFFISNNTIFGVGSDPTSGINGIAEIPVKTKVQTIKNFGKIPTLVVGNTGYDPGAAASSGLPVSYTVSDQTIANVASGLIYPENMGTASVTASQTGNSVYYAATPLTQSLTVAAPPGISYSGPNSYTIGKMIKPLIPITSNANGSIAYNSTLIVKSTGFKAPYGSAIDAAGNIYVADFNANQVLKIPAGGGTPVAIGSGFSTPAGVAVDAAGNVYVADAGNSAIKKIPAGGGAPVKIGGSGFFDPLGIALDNAGNVFVTDYYLNTVSKIPASGGSAVLVAKGFNHPIGIAVDANGNIYVADSQNSAIREIISGTNTANLLTDYFYYPTGVAVDNAGNVYVADYGNRSISILTPVTGKAEPYTPTLLNNKFAAPFGLSIDGAGNIYGADAGTHSLAEITPFGGFFINPALPAGLSFSSKTGTIAGEPTAASPATNYAITTYNNIGGSVARVNIAVSSNIATLNAMAISKGTLSPAFAITTTAYTATVSNPTTALTITPTVTDVNATIKINGEAVTSGVASPAIALLTGTNTIHITVTAQDGTTTDTYTLTVTRLSSNADLNSLVISSGSLSPAFTAANTTYTASVNNSISSITVTPTVADITASVTINGQAETSGKSSANISLNTGANLIPVVVTAQDGSITTYKITVTRAVAPLNDMYAPDKTGQAPPLIALGGQKIEASNILSPNGDGINDTWIVKNIAFYPSNTVTVYNRSGKVVFTGKNYANDWAGTYNGAVLNEGTYYYLIDLGNGSTEKGFITVLRDK